MKRWCIIFLLIALNSLFLSAQNISVDSPNEVIAGENFSIKIKLTNFETDVYDVKIDLLDKGIRVAKIWSDGQWKSTYYYINDAMNNNEEKEFILKVENYIGNIDIEIKVRDSSGSVKTFGDYGLVSKKSTQESEEPEANETKNDLEENKADGETEESLEEIKEEQIEEQTIKKSEEQTDGVLELKPIVLSPKDIKSEDDNKNSDKKNYALGGFIIFCILLTILFVIKGKKK